jgi:hypothetical protein
LVQEELSQLEAVTVFQTVVRVELQFIQQSVLEADPRVFLTQPTSGLKVDKDLSVALVAEHQEPLVTVTQLVADMLDFAPQTQTAQMVEYRIQLVVVEAVIVVVLLEKEDNSFFLVAVEDVALTEEQVELDYLQAAAEAEEMAQLLEIMLAMVVVDYFLDFLQHH